MHAQDEINIRQNYKRKSRLKIIGMEFNGYSVLDNIMGEKNNQ